MTTYFGYPANGADPVGATRDSNGNLVLGNAGYTTGFTCPGSGYQNVVELSAWVEASGAGNHMRMAVYNSSDQLMAQGSAEVELSGGPSWQGHMSAGAITVTTQLTGGTTYYLRYCKDYDGAIGDEFYITGTSGDYKYTATTGDYTGGYPTTLTLASNTAGRYCIRCGVVSASSIEQEGFRFRNDNGSESTATWKDVQDANITLATTTAFRLRMILNATGDPASIDAQLECRYKPSGGAFGSWAKVTS
jgi:hypothetical protein